MKFGNLLSGYDPVFHSHGPMFSSLMGESKSHCLAVLEKKKKFKPPDFSFKADTVTGCHLRYPLQCFCGFTIKIVFLYTGAMGIGSALVVLAYGLKPFQPTVGRALPSSPGSSTRTERVRSDQDVAWLYDFFSYIPLDQNSAHGPACLQGD